MSLCTRRAGWAGLLAGLAFAGCGADDSGKVAPAATNATPSPPATATPQTTVPTSPTNVKGTTPPAGSASGAGGGASEPSRVPATFIFTRPNRIDPPTVTIPAFVTVELTLASRDGRAHALVLHAGGRSYTLRVPAGGRAATRIPGLRAWTYPLAAIGAGPGAKLIVGGQVGP